MRTYAHNSRFHVSQPHSVLRSTRESPERPHSQPRADQSRNVPGAGHAEPCDPLIPWPLVQQPREVASLSDL